MRKFRKIQLLGVGVLTPSLVGQPQTAEARPADFAEPLKVEAANASTAKLVEMFKREVFALTPAEKISIAGDRIRLSAQQLNSKKAPVVSGDEHGITFQDGCGSRLKMNNNLQLNRQNLRVSVDGDGCTANCAGSRVKMNNNLPLNRQYPTANCAGSRMKSGTQIK